MFALLALAAPLAAQSSNSQSCPTAEEIEKLCAQGGCQNDPYEPLECWPTSYGPAEANVVESLANFLYCNGTYALCFYSGPAQSLGGEEGDPRLPCTVDADGTFAHCRCQVFSGEYYVDILSIHNRGVYFSTVAACGSDGKECLNMANGCTETTSEKCSDKVVPPVCQYINAQSPGATEEFFYPAPEVISTYSTAMQTAYGYPDPQKPGGTKNCASGLYAGCMTAACTYEERDPRSSDQRLFAQCKCPLYTGCYQVPNVEGFDCDLGEKRGQSLVWSSSNNVATVSQSDCGVQ